MDQILLNMLAFTIDMNGITDITAHDLVNYGCWCSYGLNFFNSESYRCRIFLIYKSKGSPPQDPYFLKNGQINRVTKFSSTSRSTESDSEKNWVVTLILGAETGFEIACITYITN